MSWNDFGLIEDWDIPEDDGCANRRILQCTTCLLSATECHTQSDAKHKPWASRWRGQLEGERMLSHSILVLAWEALVACPILPLACGSSSSSSCVLFLTQCASAICINWRKENSTQRRTAIWLSSQWEFCRRCTSILMKLFVGFKY